MQASAPPWYVQEYLHQANTYPLDSLQNNNWANSVIRIVQARHGLIPTPTTVASHGRAGRGRLADHLREPGWH